MFSFLKKWFGQGAREPGAQGDSPASPPLSGWEAKKAWALLAKVRRGHERAIEKLVDWQALGHFPLPAEAVTALAEALRTDQVSARIAAAHALTFFHSSAQAAMPALVDCLASADAATRLAAAETMCASGAPAEHIPAVVAILTEALTGHDLDKRQDAASVIGELGSQAKDAVPALLQSLEKADEASIEAARALEAMGPAAAPAVPVLAQALLAKNVSLRAAAAEALGCIVPAAASAASALIALLDEDGEAASEAFTALNRLGAAAVPALMTALPTAGAQGRLKIINCLGFIGPAAIAARPLLVDYSRAADETLRAAAQRALQRLEGVEG